MKFNICYVLVVLGVLPSINGKKCCNNDCTSKSCN